MWNMPHEKGVGNGEYRWVVLVGDRRDPDQRGDIMAGGEAEEMSGRTEQPMEGRIILSSDAALLPPLTVARSAPSASPRWRGFLFQEIRYHN